MRTFKIHTPKKHMRMQAVTIKELKDYLSAKHKSQVQLAKEYDISDRTVRRWISGESPIPRWVAILASHNLL